MGKKENPLLAYYNQDKRFAELMNGWFFEGRLHWSAKDISTADRRQEGRSREYREYRHRYRDLYKRLDHTLVHLFVGAELMEYVDYAMPLRVMDSDTLSYLHQKKAASRRHAEHKDLTSSEYLSQFSKTDRLLPVITLILYCGEAPWDGAKRLHEILNMEYVPDRMRECIADYPLQILDVCHTPDEKLRSFPPDIRFMLLCIKYAKDKEAFSRLKELTGSAVVSEDTYETIAEYLGEPELLGKKEKAEEGGRNMCEAIRALVEDGRNEGLRLGVEQGIEQGLAKGIDLAKQVFRMAGENISTEEIARQLSISEQEVEHILN